MARTPRKSEQLKLRCPHCNSTMRIRTSSSPSPFLRTLYLYCLDEEFCRYRCVAEMEITKTVSPPMEPNPDVERLPLARRKNR